MKYIYNYTYNELQIEKTKIRQIDPVRYDVLTMILSGASSIAKKENREVTENDLVVALKSEIRNSEKAIELIESKNGNASKQRAELVIYKSFLPSMLSEDRIKEILDRFEFSVEKNKKNFGKLMQEFKEKSVLQSEYIIDQIDMKIVSKILLSAMND